MDLFSREIVGWHMGDRMTKEFGVCFTGSTAGSRPPDDLLFPHVPDDMIGSADRQSHNGERWINRSEWRKDARVCDI